MRLVSDISHPPVYVEFPHPLLPSFFQDCADNLMDD